MRVLIIKTSSLGDILHTLPALTDASKAIQSIQFDWVVEESFAEIPRWHPFVKNVIPVAIRRWRHNLLRKETWKEWKECRTSLTKVKYDYIIDAQGLLKTAWLGWMAKGIRCGLNGHSAREPLASVFYQRKYAIAKEHAVIRNRELFSKALGYEISTGQPNYGISIPTYSQQGKQKYIIFLHGTTWHTKHWPETFWIKLAKMASQQNIAIKLLWGNQAELERAQRIAAQSKHIEILPRLKLLEIAQVLASAKVAVAVDTGLGHLAAALNVPTVSLYGPTDSNLTGALGQSQIHLSANFSCSPCLRKTCIFQNDEAQIIQPPCFASLPAEVVWQEVEKFL